MVIVARHACAEVNIVELTGTGLTPADVAEVAREDAVVTLAPAARTAMARSAAIVARIAASDEPAYGVTTGFGALANTQIPAGRRGELQRALVRSHATGMGPKGNEVLRKHAVRAQEGFDRHRRRHVRRR